MFCSKCGKKIADDALFCDGCGAKVGGDSPKARSESPKQEGKVHKCPYCGEVLAHDALKCPTCGKEIRGREVAQSLQVFFEKINSIDDEDKKIELIKTFPIPNNREDILEFMFLATSNFDAKYYATNKNKDSVASAWLSKIEQCYEKGKVMLSSQSDLAQLNNLYQKVHAQTKNVVKTKFILIIAGFLLIILGLVIVCIWGKDNTAIGAVGIALLALGIVGVVFGFKRKKTNKEIEEEKIEKANKKAAKANKNVVEEETVIKKTVIKHEIIEEEAPKVASPKVEAPKVEAPIVEAPKVEAKNNDGPISYPAEDVVVMNKFVLRQNEKIIVKIDVDYVNDDDENEYEVALTNKALYYLRKDDEEERVDEATRIPLSQISQVVYKKGGFLDGNVLEVYREGAVDKIDGNKKLALLELAINDRFDSLTVNRDYRYYDNLNLKDIK